MKKTFTILVAILGIGLSLNGQIPTDGLVGYWPFTGNANDDSGNGNDGIVDGATLTTDRFGNTDEAYSFDGETSKIYNNSNLRSVFDNNNAYSINFWFYPEERKEEMILFACDGTNVSPFKRTWVKLSLGETADFIQFSRFNRSTMNTYGDVGFFIHLPSKIELNKWYHLSANYDGNDAEIYLNGNKQIRTENTGWTDDHNKTMGGPDNYTIGITLADNNQNNLNSFKGKIDDVLLYNRALDPAEIDSLSISTGDSTSTDPTKPTLSSKLNFGGTSTDLTYAACASPDGGYVVAATVKSFDGDIFNKYTADTLDSDIWLCKINKYGEMEWSKTYGGSGDDAANSIIPLASGGYLIAGNTKSGDGDISNAGFHATLDMLVIKIDDDGNKDWIKCYGGTGYESADNLLQTSSGDIIIAGMTYNSGSSGDLAGTTSRGWTDAFILKIDTSGNIIWKQRYGGNLDDRAKDMVETEDGGFIFACEAESYAGSGEVSVNIGNNHTYDYWILKLNSSGSIEWKKNFGGTSTDMSPNIRKLGDGNYLIAGFSQSNNGDASGNHGNIDGFLVKMDPSGNKIWSKMVGGSGEDVFNDILVHAEDRFLLAGYTNSTDGDVVKTHAGYDGWLIEMDNNGTLIESICLGSSKEDRFYDLDLLKDSRVLVAGMSGAADGDVITSKGGKDIWVFTFGEPDFIETTEQKTICFGEPFIFGDEILYETGTYYDTLQMANGGDSIITLELTVNPSYEETKYQTLCEGESVSFAGKICSETGIYFDSLHTTYGCDSIIILDLKVNPGHQINLYQNICKGETFSFSDKILSEPGTYYDSLNTIEGCDSIIILELTVNPAYFESTTHEICEGETIIWNGQVIGQSGLYTENYASVSGCDSITELILTVYPSPENFAISGPNTVNEFESGTYSTPLNMDVSYKWYAENGDIVANPSDNSTQIQWGEMAEGVVSVIAISQHGCTSDTSKLMVSIGNTRTLNSSGRNINFYPNPATDILKINGLPGKTLVSIFSVNGQVMISRELENEAGELDISELSSGYYILKLEMEKEVIVRRFAVK